MVGARTPQGVLWALSLAGAVLSAHAAELEGHVVAGPERVVFPGARVEIVELQRESSAGPQGEFAFHDLPPGEYTLRVSAPGTAARIVERRVRVDGSAPLAVEVALAAGAAQAIVVVTARREAARAAEREAPNLVSVISADEIRSLPEVSAAEAVRRVPGISAENDTGEARFINIRGLNADLNGTTFAGVRMLPTNPASPLNGSRAVAFDVIPAGLIGSITVTKTNTPDMDAEALGGTIELTPRRLGSEERPFLNARVGSGYEPLRQTGILDLQLAGGGRFAPAGGDQRFSAVGTLTIYEDHRGIDDLEESYVDAQAAGVPDKAFNDLQQRYYRLRRTRLGFGGELAFEPSDGHRFYLDAYQTGYTEFQNKDYLITQFTGNAAAVPGGNDITDTVDSYIKHATDHQETLRARLLSLGARQAFAQSTLDYRVSYSEGRYIVSKDYSWDFQASGNGAAAVYDNITRPNWPSYTVSRGPNPLDPASFSLLNVANGSESDRDREYSSELNWATPPHWWGERDELKFGASARLRDKVLAPHQITFLGDSIPAVSLSQFVTPDTITYYDDHYRSGRAINLLALEAYYAAGNGLVEDAASDALADTQSYQHNREDVYALYGQYSLTRGAVGLLGGVRLEHTRATYAANAVTLDAAGNATSILLNTQYNSYTNAFPTLQLRYEITPRFLARASLSSAIARPAFNQITAAIQLTPSSGSVSQGNPQLQPTKGYNLDLGLERYFERGGVLSIGLFDKELRNYIINTDQRIDASQLPPNPIYRGFVGPVDVTTFANIRQARATGLEFEWEQQFKDLPGIWSGLGVGANWTWVDSRGDLRPGMSSALPGTSRNTANAQLFYDYQGLNLKVAAYYTSRALFSPNPSDASGYTDAYQSERLIVDLGANFAFSKSTGVYFNVKNLTDNAMRYTEGPENRPIQREFYGVTVQAGVVLSY